MRKFAICASFLGLLMAGASFASAATQVGPITIGGDISLFTRYTKNPKFGGEEGQYGYTPDRTYGEVYGTVFLSGETQTPYGTLSAELRPYFVKTLGEDFFGIMQDGSNNYADYMGRDKNPANVGLDQAWLKMSRIAKLPVDITIGRQEITIEKGFLFGISGDSETAIWHGKPYSFPLAVRADGEFGPVSWTGFYAKSDNYRDALEDDVKTYGLNLHYTASETAYIYGGVFQKDEPKVGSGDSTQGDTYENDTLTYNLGGELGLGPVVLEGEFALQRGDIVDKNGKVFDRDSLGYWASATYNTALSMAPYFRLMYQSYSGDSDGPEGNFDSLHSGFTAWNRFFTGEVVSEGQLLNSNRENYVVEVGFYPSEVSMVTMAYINHRLLEVDGPKKWADEVNIFFDSGIAENVTLSLGAGYAIAGGAAKKEYGASDDAIFTQMQLVYAF